MLYSQRHSSVHQAARRQDTVASRTGVVQMKPSVTKGDQV